MTNVFARHIRKMALCVAALASVTVPASAQEPIQPSLIDSAVQNPVWSVYQALSPGREGREMPDL